MTIYEHARQVVMAAAAYQLRLTPEVIHAIAVITYRMEGGHQ